jgi:drug/metabolite transporter (DMT)-like permease
MRFGIGVIILGITVSVRRQFALPAKSDLAYFALLGFIGVTFHQWLQATGLQTARATTTAWIVATIPVFTALLGWLVLKEKMGWIRVGGIVIAALGVLLIVSNGDLSALVSGETGAIGDLLILISALNWAVYTILSRRELARHPAARMLFYVMLFGWLFSCIWIFGFGPALTEIPHLTASGWTSILVLGIFGSGLAYIAWYDALQAIPASQLGVFINIEPLVTMMLAAPMLGEQITLISLLGGAIIILGVWLVNR